MLRDAFDETDAIIRPSTSFVLRGAGWLDRLGAPAARRRHDLDHAEEGQGSSERAQAHQELQDPPPRRRGSVGRSVGLRLQLALRTTWESEDPSIHSGMLGAWPVHHQSPDGLGHRLVATGAASRAEPTDTETVIDVQTGNQLQRRRRRRSKSRLRTVARSWCPASGRHHDMPSLASAAVAGSTVQKTRQGPRI